jgi:hypothetical protein
VDENKTWAREEKEGRRSLELFFLPSHFSFWPKIQWEAYKLSVIPLRMSGFSQVFKHNTHLRDKCILKVC